ncbi:hypothetical protein GALL_464320 [mine drainage metagenome]|uniref:Uncharacterized protein n=1 Tax=mine drainage metagenome TaxID=410659 RepID=A0A1J5Q3A7_9ZZZZ
MAALAGINNATPSLQYTLIQNRIEAARREADQAQSHAENLRLQADDQERVVQQARQRTRTLEKSASQLSGKSNIQDATQINPTYTETLADVFQSAETILKSGLSGTEKNLVAANLFAATNQVWTTQPAISKAIQSYDNQVIAAPLKAMGRLLNTAA